jgi:KDO2-lipid IV(A) lauroyltransferase
MLTRLALGLIWLLHGLPLALLAPIGEGLGLVGYALAGARRRVCLANLAACFPDLGPAQRRALARKHFRLFGRFVLEHGIQWHASIGRVRRLVQLEDEQHFQAVKGKRFFFLAPHFLGLDFGGVRLAMETELTGMYARQKDPRLDQAVLTGRMRFALGRTRMFSRQEGFRPVARAVRSGIPFYYMPDMDLGARDGLFVPFFGVPAATITGVSRLAQIAGATVLPVVTRMLPGGAGYRVKFYPPWTDFPSGDVLADTRRINAFIEDRVRELPEQYYWLHKRFKTRPPGEAKFY